MSASMIEEKFAVRVRKGCKNYGNNSVMDNLNMRVPVGSTYALLGSSGCGKTTLLSSLIGMRKLDSGSVQLFGKYASQEDIISLVGFMPQETGLHPELTFSEELHYYGRLYGLDWTLVEERMAFFLDLLQLVDVKDKQIRNMSGGQTRRVSLAVALLNRPRLIILDEPTVGVDPLLRESIWEYLFTLVREESVTIILSTHYTEEARQADVVSVMRNGKLLVEENPTSLMLRYGSDILEEVVIKLCLSQETYYESEPIEPIIFTASPWRSMSMDNISNVIATEGNKNITNISYKRWKNSIGHGRDGTKTMPSNPTKWTRVSWLSRHLQKIYAIFILNMILVMRNPAILAFQVFLPPIDMALTYVTYSHDPYADIGIVNLEQPNCLQNLQKNVQKLGCELTHYFQESNELTLHEFPSEKAASEAVRRGRNYGYILFPANYSRNWQNRVAFGRYADEGMLDGSTITARLDMSNYVRNRFILTNLHNGIAGFADKKLHNGTEGIQKEQGKDFQTSLKAFEFNAKMGKLGAMVGTWETGATISRTALVTWIMPTFICATLITDRKQGSHLRMLVGGGTMKHLFLAIMASSFLSMFLLQIGLLLGTSYVILGIPFKGSICQYLIINYGQSLVGISLGFFLGAVFNQQLEAIVIIIGLFKFVLLAHLADSSGVSPGMRWFVYSLPTKLASMSVENIMFRGWSIWSNFHVWCCFIVQAAWILSSLALARLNSRRTRE